MADKNPNPEGPSGAAGKGDSQAQLCLHLVQGTATCLDALGILHSIIPKGAESRWPHDEASVPRVGR